MEDMFMMYSTATNITLPAWTFQTGQQAHWLTVIFSVEQLDTEKHFQIETISRTAANNNNHNPQQGGTVLKSQLFNTDENRVLTRWSSVRYERTCASRTRYKLFGRK